MHTSLAARVLVIDDNEASAKTLGWMLEFLGYEVRWALGAQSSLDTAREFKPHIVLMDIGLPDMSGYELCRLMRREPLFKHTAFIAQTGWGQAQHRQQSREAGFHHHLLKPIQIPELQAVLHSVAQEDESVQPAMM